MQGAKVIFFCLLGLLALGALLKKPVKIYINGCLVAPVEVSVLTLCCYSEVL